MGLGYPAGLQTKSTKILQGNNARIKIKQPKASNKHNHPVKHWTGSLLLLWRIHHGTNAVTHPSCQTPDWNYGASAMTQTHPSCQTPVWNLSASTMTQTHPYPVKHPTGIWANPPWHKSTNASILSNNWLIFWRFQASDLLNSLCRQSSGHYGKRIIRESVLVWLPF